jgi:protein-disulfide isomerase
MAFEGWVEAASDAAADADVSATPTVLVDGEQVQGEVADIAEAMVGSGG